MDFPGIKPDFLDRFWRQSVTKLITLILADHDFMDDVRSAPTMLDYTEYLRTKKRTSVETIFFLLPTEEQTEIWKSVKGGNNGAR